MFVLGGTGEVEFDIKRGNSDVLAGFGLFLPDISRFPQAGVPRLDLQANANDGKACLAAYSSRYLCQVKRHHVPTPSCFDAIQPFPASGSPSAGFASKCERRQGKPCRVLIAIPLPSEKAPRKRGAFSLGRGDAIRTRNLRFWRPLLYR